LGFEVWGLGFGGWGLGFGVYGWGIQIKISQAVWISQVDVRCWVQDLPLSNEYGTHKRKSRPGFQVKVLETFQGVPISLGSGSFDLGAGVRDSFRLRA